MADENGGLKVIEGGGAKAPTPEFAKDTRTSIQKRIQPRIVELKAALKAVIDSEFAPVGGSLKAGDMAHERRFARSLGVEVARLMFDAGIRLSNIGSGLNGAGESLRSDLIEQGVIKVEKPQFDESYDESEEENEDDEEGEEDGQ